MGQFDTNPVSVLQSLMQFDKGYDFGNQVQDRGAARAAAPLIASGDYRGALAKLMANGGNLQGALAVAGLGNQDRAFNFQQQEALRAQGNADRQFGLQQQTANTAQVMQIEDANGNKRLVRIDRQGNTADITPNAADAPNNPFSYGKLNENQSKDAGYANRMFSSEQVLRDPKSIAAATSATQRTIDQFPMLGSSGATGLGNYIQSSEYQRYDQAARDFINATLRRESGAAISQSEFDNAYKQYLPRPGDSPEVLQQKQRNRQATIASIAGGGGNNYKPPFSFDASGNMLPTGNAQQGVTKGSRIPSGLLNEAKSAIAAGKDPAGVKAKLQQSGFDISGLDF